MHHVSLQNQKKNDINPEVLKKIDEITGNFPFSDY